MITRDDIEWQQSATGDRFPGHVSTSHPLWQNFLDSSTHSPTAFFRAVLSPPTYFHSPTPWTGSGGRQRLNDQVTELMNSFQNPGFYRYQPFERLQPDEVSGADNSSSHSDTFQDEAQLPPREPSPQPSTSTQSVTNKMVDSKRVRRTTKVRNKTQVIDQGEESKLNLRTIKATATTKLQKSEVAVLIAAVKRAARNKHRLMDLSITKETKSRARSDETKHSQNLHSDERFSEFSGRLSRTQVDRRKRLLYVDTSRPRPFYRQYPVDHSTGPTYERHQNKRLDVTSSIQPLEELVRNQLTKHLGLRRLSHAVTSGCLALPKTLRHRLLTFSTSDFVEDRDEKEEDNDGLKTSQSVGTFKVRCRHDNQAYQATFFTSEADKEMYDLWTENEKWLAPHDRINQILAITGETKTQNIFMISTPHDEWRTKADLLNDCPAKDLSECKSLLSDMGMSHVNVCKTIVRVGSFSDIKVQNPLLIMKKTR